MQIISRIHLPCLPEVVCFCRATLAVTEATQTTRNAKKKRQ